MGALDQDQYVIIKPGMLTRKFEIRDKDGNVLFEAKPNILGTELTITDSSGKAVGEAKHKMISLVPTFYLYDGNEKNGKLLGIVKKPALENMMSMTQKLAIEDQNGNVLANASGSIFGLGQASRSYSIVDSQGTLIAKINSSSGSSVMGWLGDMAKDAYYMQITEPGKLQTLVLIEFLLCIELMRETQNKNQNMGVRGFGIGGGNSGGIQL